MQVRENILILQDENTFFELILKKPGGMEYLRGLSDGWKV